MIQQETAPAMRVDLEAFPGSATLAGSVVRDYDGAGWRRSVFVPRVVAREQLRNIWNRFVSPCGCGGHGQAFAGAPTLRKVGRAGWLMEQSGGIDV
jgi:hypothetical protein